MDIQGWWNRGEVHGPHHKILGGRGRSGPP